MCCCVQAGFILYNPNPRAEKWDPDSHEQMMIITMMFAWHMAAAFILLLLLGLAVRLVERCCCLETPSGERVLANGRHYDRIKLVPTGSEAADENRNSVVEFESGGEGSGDETMFERGGVKGAVVEEI